MNYATIHIGLWSENLKQEGSKLKYDSLHPIEEGSYMIDGDSRSIGDSYYLIGKQSK
jgi:hypothetical protein